MGTLPPKVVNNADAGDADHVGGNDWDDIAQWMNNTDKTGPIKFNTRTYFRDDKFELRNPADTFSYIFSTSAITSADKTVTLPLLTASDTFVFNDFPAPLANKTLAASCDISAAIPTTFTEPLTIKKDTQTLLTLWRDTSTVSTSVDLNLDVKNSAGTQKTAGAFRAQLFDVTPGAEKGEIRFRAMKNGSVSTIVSADQNGFFFGENNLFGGISDAGLTDFRVHTFPDVSSRLHSVTHNYFERNDEFNCGSISNTNTSNSIGVLGWGTSASGTSAPVVTAGVLNHPGIISLVTGATSTNNNRLHLTDSASAAFIDADDVESIKWIVRVPTITSIEVRLGIGQDISAANFGTAGAFFSFIPGTSANWQCITREASTSTTNTSSVAVTAGNWYMLEIKRVSGTNFAFYINDTLVFTHSTNQPTTAVNVGAIVQTSTTAARTLDVDYFQMSTIQLGQRWT